MSFWKPITLRLALMGLTPLRALGITVAMGLLTAFVYFQAYWNVSQCAGALQAETAFSEAYREFSAMGPVRIQNDPSCPAARHFVEVAERTLPMITICRGPMKHGIGFPDFAAFVTHIKAQISEHCPAP